MTAEEFKKGYCQQSNITEEYFDKYFVVMTCNCGCDECDGFARIFKDADSIEHQRRFYGGELCQVNQARQSLLTSESQCRSMMQSSRDLPKDRGSGRMSMNILK